jgi:Fur family transcriptional regulator, peroxide stress response regulator
MNSEPLSTRLIEKGLKVTPQRMAIFEAIIKLNNHPTAENIVEYIRKNHPNIAVATVYKVLDALAENQLIKKVTTEKDVMRYDAIIEPHHHIYCSDSDRIEDYFDDDLNELLMTYFRKKQLPGFTIEDLKLQIIGRFKS